MIATRFKKTEKDFSSKIAMLKALGVKEGSRILDYGASWGYGTWQLREAGFEAIGYELSRPRARYAREMLNTPVKDDVNHLTGRFDVFFSSHVLEHLSSPLTAFEVAMRWLRPGGMIVALTPNGSEACRQANPDLYRTSWGRLHPLYLDDAFYLRHFRDHPIMLSSSPYFSPYPLHDIQRWNKQTRLVLDLAQRELLVAILL